MYDILVPFEDVIAFTALISAIAALIFPVYLRILKKFIEGAKKGANDDLQFRFKKRFSDYLEKPQKSDKLSEQQLNNDLASLKGKLEACRQEISEHTRESLRADDGGITDNWREVLFVSRNRLSSESKRLKERSTANLTLGVAFSIVAAITLAALLFLFPDEDIKNSTSSFILFFVPRLTIVLLIQVVAAFFLRMHAHNEKDIEKNKNQITDLETKYVAIQIAESAGRSEDLIELLALGKPIESGRQALAARAELDRKTSTE